MLDRRAVCVGEAGMWGALVMHRERGAPNFTTRDVDLLASLSGGCPDVQRVRLERDLSADAGDRDRGLLLLDEKDGIEMADTAAAAWLDELPGRGRRLPLVVTAVAHRAREIASGRSDVAATARVGTAAGRWVLVRGSVLGNGTDVRTAVTLEQARAPELAELVADAHGLTARERRVTELVSQGLCTAAIAARLYLSTYTVQLVNGPGWRWIFLINVPIGPAVVSASVTSGWRAAPARLNVDACQRPTPSLSTSTTPTDRSTG
jgi:hypothetical protein